MSFYPRHPYSISLLPRLWGLNAKVSPSVLQNNPKSLLARSPFRSLMNGWSPQGTCMRDQLSVLMLHLGENCLPSVSLW